MKSLRRFWFVFEHLGTPTPLNLGCGVTAFDYDDAVNILRKRVFVGMNLPGILECIENIDVSTLDRKHVLPNLGLVTARGVWFPQGYAE